jgi:hypothetical protein
MIIGYLRPSLYLCLMAILWSGVSASMCGTTNFTGLVLVRFFLGVVEAPLLPGAFQMMLIIRRLLISVRRGLLDGLLVYPQRDGHESCYPIHWTDVGFLHGRTNRCCCFWDSRSSKCFPAIPKHQDTNRPCRNMVYLDGSGYSLSSQSVALASPWSPFSSYPIIHIRKLAVQCGQ